MAVNNARRRARCISMIEYQKTLPRTPRSVQLRRRGRIGAFPARGAAPASCDQLPGPTPRSRAGGCARVRLPLLSSHINLCLVAAVPRTLTAPIQPGDILCDRYRVDRVLGAG